MFSVEVFILKCNIVSKLSMPPVCNQDQRTSWNRSESEQIDWGWDCRSGCVTVDVCQREGQRKNREIRGSGEGVTVWACCSFRGSIVLNMWLIEANSSGEKCSCLKQQYWDPEIKTGFRYIFKEVFKIRYYQYLFCWQTEISWAGEQVVRLEGQGWSALIQGVKNLGAGARLGALRVSWSSLCKL